MLEWLEKGLQKEETEKQCYLAIQSPLDKNDQSLHFLQQLYVVMPEQEKNDMSNKYTLQIL